MIQCSECGFESHTLYTHVQEAHGMEPGAYEGPLFSAAAVGRASKVKRKAIAEDSELHVKLMGFEMRVDAGVDPADCLPLPDNYLFPTRGKAKSVFERAMMALAGGRNCFIWGMPGTGKDAIVHAFSAMTRRPVVMVTFRPGTDLAPWFYTRSIDANGTGWEFGHLWRALVEGIEGRDGVRRAPLVLLSDADRADSAQAEWFRILTDSISGRILGPDGKMVPLFPGCQFLCTANSCGTGDERGRMASANPMDASIMDRLGRKIEADYMDWEDESQVLRAKYPAIVEKCPTFFQEMGRATAALRAAIKSQELYAEFTHRGLCDICDEAVDILRWVDPRDPNQVLARAFSAWLDGMDTDSRLTAIRLISGHVSGKITA